MNVHAACLVRVASAAALLAFGVRAQEAAAQGTDTESERAYVAARSDYSVLLEDRDATFSRYERALDRVGAARNAGDPAGRDAAYAAFQVVAFELMELEVAVEQAGARVALRRAEYLAALEAREAELLGRLEDGLPDGGPSDVALLEEWRAVRTRQLEIQAEALPAEAAVLRPVPELTVDPRDGPVESLEKARFMEEQVGSYDSLIVDLDRQVSDLERQLQQRQSVEDLLRDVGRFGTDFIPGGPPDLAVPDGGAGPEIPQSAALQDPEVALMQLPVAEQIEFLRAARDLAIQYRDQALRTAELFRERAEGMR